MSNDPFLAAAEELARIAGRGLSEFPQLTAELQGFAAEFLFFRAGSVSNIAVMRAVDGIVADLRSIETKLAVLRQARWATAFSEGDRRNVYTLVNAFVVDTLLPGHGVAWDDSAYQNPDPYRHTKRAGAIERYAAQLELKDLPSTTRPGHAAFEQLIGRLANIYLHVSGRPASAASAGRSDYVPPFLRFVNAFWPAIDDAAPPSAKTIARVLTTVPPITAE